MSFELGVLLAITFLAAVVTGAFGYGFSSLTMPVALLFYANRVLNPAVVALEVLINAYTLVVNRAAIRAVWWRAFPLVVGLVPGIVAGGLALSAVSPEWLKLGMFIVLLPLILLQAAGWRRPIRAAWPAGATLGGGVGVLYALTTVSGPPLALFFNNQGFVKHEFRAALGVVRLTESILTALVYYALGMYMPASVGLIPLMLPGVLIGIPLGAVLVHRMGSETFRRICMSFDAWVVGFGLSWIVEKLGLIQSPASYSIWLGAGVLDGYLLYRYFAARSPLAPRPRRARVLAVREAQVGADLGRNLYGGR
jgi:hypothetical protein